MSVGSNLKVAVAATNHSKMDVSATTITSQNFLICKPVWYYHMIPNTTLKGNIKSITRMDSVATPCYGRCRVNIRSFYVPYRTVFPNANEFFTDTIASSYLKSALVPKAPSVYNDTLVKYFLTYTNAYGGLVEWLQYNDPDDATSGAYDPTNPNAVPYDFCYSDDSVNPTTNKYYRFTYQGRVRYSLLLALGYELIWLASDQSEFSALGLLCWAKVYCDWYSNSQYLDSSAYLYLERLFKYNDPNSSLMLSQTDLEKIFDYTLFVVYDGSNEVFLNAWDTPMAPNPGTGSTNFRINDVSLQSQGDLGNLVNQTFVKQDSSGTPIFVGLNGSGSLSYYPYQPTEFIHTALRAMTDAVARHRLSGARAVDRFLVDYGVNLDSAKANRSIFVSTKSEDVDFGSVMSNADTSSSDISNLGDYAGVGFGRREDDFDFHCDEFGMFIVVSSILPSAEFVQGIDRQNYHLTKLDFWNPNYDNLSCQAINRSEVYVSRNGQFGLAGDYDGVFGFAPRYYEYKVGRSHITGDFAFKSVMAGADAWNLARLFNDASFGNSAKNIVHSLNFTRGVDGVRYNRIFNDTTNIDKFYCFYRFSVQALAPCKSLFDSYDFEDEGKKIIMQSNGTKLN